MRQRLAFRGQKHLKEVARVNPFAVQAQPEAMITPGGVSIEEPGVVRSSRLVTSSPVFEPVTFAVPKNQSKGGVFGLDDFGAEEKEKETNIWDVISEVAKKGLEIYKDIRSSREGEGGSTPAPPPSTVTTTQPQLIAPAIDTTTILVVAGVGVAVIATVLILTRKK